MALKVCYIDLGAKTVHNDVKCLAGEQYWVSLLVHFLYVHQPSQPLTENRVVGPGLAWMEGWGWLA